MRPYIVGRASLPVASEASDPARRLPVEGRGAEPSLLPRGQWRAQPALRSAFRKGCSSFLFES
jgi:hypothetical protein